MSDFELTKPITPPDRTEEENWYVLVVTTLIWQLNLENADVDLGEPVTVLPGRDAFWNPCMAAVFSGPTRRTISCQGTSDVQYGTSKLTDDHLWAEGLTDDHLKGREVNR